MRLLQWPRCLSVPWGQSFKFRVNKREPPYLELQAEVPCLLDWPCFYSNPQLGISCCCMSLDAMADWQLTTMSPPAEPINWFASDSRLAAPTWIAKCNHDIMTMRHLEPNPSSACPSRSSPHCCFPFSLENSQLQAPASSCFLWLRFLCPDPRWTGSTSWKRLAEIEPQPIAEQLTG
ncbi:hypothetical protein BDV18DRAFT_128444 [Aspergillus unguis]